MYDFHKGELELAIKDEISNYHTWAMFRMRLSSVHDNPQSQQKNSDTYEKAVLCYKSTLNATNVIMQNSRGGNELIKETDWMNLADILHKVVSTIFRRENSGIE